MSLASSIEWTEATWNPVVGCRKVSAGCANCYAERMSKRLAAMATADIKAGRNPGKKAGYLHVINKRGRWNGDVFLDESAVDSPRSWRSPRVIFVNSMSDLFHEDVPLEFIKSVFTTMNDCQQHTFQLLTKRPERVRELSPKLAWGSNIWMGTSVENQSVTSRVRELRGTRAIVKFLSVEPLLGPIPRLPIAGMDWVIVGGESGPGARPMDPAWVRQIRDRCKARGVPFFFKQWGGIDKGASGRRLDGRTWDQMPKHTMQSPEAAR
ncbi:MAG: phage Gp37/Gp68 family protein [Planctomycetota bacterium]